MIVDMPLADLMKYRPALTSPPDFDAFWEQTLAQSASQPLRVQREPVAYPVGRVSVARVTFDGFSSDQRGDTGKTRICGWKLTPREPLHVGPDGKQAAIVVFHGYSGSKRVPAAHLRWALQGFHVFAVDTRGQDGDTPDNQAYPTGAALGCMTRGIDDPLTYYYRFAFMDCVRAVQVARAEPEIGPMLLTGRSQGGGLTLAVAALSPDQAIALAMPDVPYLCHFVRAVEIFSDGPYQELVNHWQAHPGSVERNFRTLSYFDGMNLAPRVTCPTLLSLGLLDTICPPSTGFAVYNHLGTSEKAISVYPFNGHEGGDILHEEEQYRFVRQRLAIEE
ncbi:MAG: alpha/beta fold hydrolase [Ktedonobacterales bacterium]